MKGKIALFLVLCFIFASFPFGVVASDYIEYAYYANMVDIHTNCDYNPDDYPEGGEYDFNGVRITRLIKYSETNYRIYLTSDWDAKDAVAVLEQSENIVSAEIIINYSAKKEPSTEPQYLTENLVDFEVFKTDSPMTFEAKEEYKNNGHFVSYGFDMPVEVMQSKQDLDEYLTKYEDYAEIHEFASSLYEDYFDTYALFVIYAWSGTLGSRYYVLGVASTEQRTIIEYEYSYETLGLTANQDTAIIIQVKKSDVKNFDNVITYSTDLVSEAVNYTLPGDVFRTGRHDAKDYSLIKRYTLGTAILSEAQKKLADVNGDGNIDKKDYILVKRACFGTYVIE